MVEINGTAMRLPIKSSGLLIVFFTTSASELPSFDASKKTSIGTCWLAATANGLEKDGKVLTDSEQVGQWGAPTLDVWVVRKDFAEKHPEVVKAFAKSAIDAQQPYIANPDAWLKQPENISKLARLSGVPEGDVPGLVKGNTYLTPQQQTVELTGPVNKAIIDTAQFLKEQGKVPAVANDYSQYVTSRFVQ